MSYLIGFTDDEVRDLVWALTEAQQELCCGEGRPEANAQWERWEALIRMLGAKKGRMTPNVHTA